LFVVERVDITKCLAALIGLQPIKAEISRHAAAELSQAHKQRLGAWLSGALECSTPEDLYIDIVALFQVVCVDNRRRQAYRQTVAPS